MNFKVSLLPCIALLLSILVLSCSKDSKRTEIISEELTGYVLTSTMKNENHHIELYTKKGQFTTGHNPILLQIKNLDGSLINDAKIEWMPMMKMKMMEHSCPFSEIKRSQVSEASPIYTGYIIFQMAENESEYWELTLNYSIAQKSYSVKERISVTGHPQRVVQSFKANDDTRYLIAIHEPFEPKIGLNDLNAFLYKMDGHHGFVSVSNYTIKIDPRMPGMGNHGSPNNTDLVPNHDVYSGKLSLSMTGYWVINLQVENEEGLVIAGDAITAETEKSSIYFDLTF